MQSSKTRGRFLRRGWFCHRPFCEVRLDLKFLIRTQAYLSLEALISGEADLYTVFSRCDQHRFSHSVELAHMSNEDVIHENCCTIGIHGEFDFRSDRRQLHSSIFLQSYAKQLLLSRLQFYLFREIQVASLPHQDFVSAGYQQDLLGAFQFLEIAK